LTIVVSNATQNFNPTESQTWTYSTFPFTTADDDDDPATGDEENDSPLDRAVAVA
jgi:hypothetical protein